eukprot:s1190_g14.t1
MNVPPGEASLNVPRSPTATDGSLAGVHAAFSRPFAMTIPKTCDQCGQEFGKVDSFAPEGSNSILRCSKYKMNTKTGMRDLPHGSECHPCQEIAERWEERRTENAIPQKRVLANQMDVSAFKQKESYTDKFEELDWYPLDSYIRKVAGAAVLSNLTSEAQKIEFVTRELRQKIQYDNGRPGVTCLVHDDGRKRIHAGTRTGLTKRQDLQPADTEGVEQMFQSYQRGAGSQFSQAMSLEHVSEQFHQLAEYEDCQQDVGLTGLCVIIQVAIQRSPLIELQKFEENLDDALLVTSRLQEGAEMQRSDQDMDDWEPSLALSSDVFDAENARPPKPSTANRGKGKGGKAKPAMLPNPDADVEMDGGDGPAEELSVEPEETKGKKGAKGKGKKGKVKDQVIPSPACGSLQRKQLEALQKAQDLFNKTKPTLTDEEIWNNSTRRRVIDAAIKSLTTADGALLPIVDTYKPAEELSRAITAWCDNLEVRFTLLSSFRPAPFQYLAAGNLDDTTFNQLLAMQNTMLSTLITHVASAALKGIEQD